ncbi:MAG: hypothetical protein ABWK05_07145 [Pyrobaculum sp.]
MESEQFEAMIEVEEDKLSDWDWWEGAWDYVAESVETWEREDKTIYSWAYITALAYQAHGEEISKEFAKFMATVFSVAHDYHPTKEQVTVGEFIKGMFEYAKTGHETWLDKMEIFMKRFDPTWTRFYRESNYYLTLEPRSVAEIGRLIVRGASTEEAVEALKGIAQSEAKSLRSVAINLRYMSKFAPPDVADTLKGWARELERLHKR